MTSRPTLLLAVLALVLVVAVRTLVSGWGPPARPPSGATTFGIAAFPADNLSYSAWAQQAKGGAWRFGILYTTTAHEPVMFNSLFLLVGGLARLVGGSPLLVLNVVAALSLPVFILAVAGVCRRLGLGGPATLGATVLALGGGGISWVRKGIEWSGLDRVLPPGPPGPDLSYYDIYPVVAYFIAPYHSIAFAVVALLTLLIVRLEDVQERLTWTKLVALLVVALGLATARPHVSVVLLGAYWAVAALGIALGLPAAVRARRLVVAACLTGAMLPPIVYAVWVSRLPVWRAFAQMHRPAVHDWLVGFFLLWVLAAIGAAVLGPRLWRTPYAFPAAWAVAAALLLIVLNGFLNPKLTAGFTIAVAVLAGAALEAWSARTASRRSVRLVIALVVFAALASPAITIARHTQQPTTVAGELFEVIHAIRRDTTSRFPTVLTDCGTGVLLPGLAGHRVFCGHWALTEGNRPKIVLLSGLGFLGESEALPSFSGVEESQVAAWATTLRHQVAAGTFEYLVVRKSYRIHRELEALATRCTVHDGPRYRVLRMCADVRAELERRLRG